MRVPREIRDMERPDHTVVEPYQSGRFAVRTRVEVKDGKGNVVFRKNQVIGYITDKYHPLNRDPPMKTVGRIDSKQYGAAFLLNSLCRDIFDDLCGFYSYGDAEWIYCASLIRASYPGIPDCKLLPRYRHSFVSEFHPGVAMGKDSVSEMFTLLGEQFRTSEKFMISRMSKVPEEDLIVIDGCLKQDNGELSISKASRKTAALKVCHHLMMYAYSPLEGEPLCSKIYPGNVSDSVAVKDFVESLEIHRGIIVADRGFRPEVMMKVAQTHEGLHYLVPLMKNRDVATRSGCFSFDKVLMRDDGPISCRRTKALGKNGEDLGYWLYSFKNPRIASEMESEYLEANVDRLDPDLLEAERKWFGVLILQSDQEIGPDLAYDSYDDRWGIEPLFKLHKSGIDLDDTREKSEETAIGSEFVNFLATLMSARLRNHLAKFDLCRNRSFKDCLSDLRDCVKVRNDDGSWEYRITTAKDMRFYVRVGAVTDREMVDAYGETVKPAREEGPRKRGRPPGSKDTRPRTRRTVAELTRDRSAKST
jgi:Transposase DDE domain.